MKRVKLIVAYDGTGYCGWQVQPNEITVEGVLNKHISEDQKRSSMYYNTDHIYFCGESSTGICQGKRDHKADPFHSGNGE